MESNISQEAEFGFRTLYESHDMGLLDYVTEADHHRQTTNIPGFKETMRYVPKYSQAEIAAKEKKSKRTINKFFSNMARLGMSLDEQVIKNMRALPADKDLLPKEKQEVTSSLYNQLLSAWKVKDNKDRNFFEKDFTTKRDQLRALAMQPELEDILDKMTNESIVYDSNYVYFMEPYIDDNDLIDFSKDIQNKINDSITKSFKRFYRMLRWRTKAWDDFKRWLIEGIIALEIVYDSLEKPTQIIGLVPIDPATLTKKFENDKWYWIQFAGINGKERKLLDSQVIYIQFQETQSISRLSYLERLVRPYNIYRIIEQAQIIWVVTNAQYRTKFTIPVKGMNRARGSQTLNAAMNRYREDIKFISDTGELTINGQAQMPFNKEYWMPESEAGTPEIDTLGGDGPELMDSDYLKYFKNQLYGVSNIPINRFDHDNDQNWFGTDADSYLRSEIDFGRYVARQRNVFSQIIIKPMWLQLCLDIPDMQTVKDFQTCIQVQYKSYNLFEELMQIQLMDKRVEFIQNMKESMIDMDKEGNEIKYFSSKFLVQKYLHLSDADIKLNEKYKQEEIEQLNLAGSDDESGCEFESIRQELEEVKSMLLEQMKLRDKRNNRPVVEGFAPSEKSDGNDEPEKGKKKPSKKGDKGSKKKPKKDDEE